MIRFILPDLRRLENSHTAGLVLYRFEELVPFTGVSSLVDWRLHGHLSKITINGFFDGSLGKPLLMPLGRFLPQQFLLVLGLGPREAFAPSVFKERIEKTFDIARGLQMTDLTLALPGRVENACQCNDAIEWFIEVYEPASDMNEMMIIEPVQAQKAMVPAVERWRLRGLVPGA